jgi:hypothetical protein
MKGFVMARRASRFQGLRGRALRGFQGSAFRQLQELSGNRQRNAVNRQLVRLSGTGGQG